MRLLLLGTIFAALSCGATASDKDNSSSTQGAVSCGKYIEERGLKGWSYTVIKGWVAGYVTAYNGLAPDTYDILGKSDLNHAMLWMEDYCKAHPLENLANGMKVLMTVLYPKRTRTAKDAGR